MRGAAASRDRWGSTQRGCAAPGRGAKGGTRTGGPCRLAGTQAGASRRAPPALRPRRRCDSSSAHDRSLRASLSLPNPPEGPSPPAGPLASPPGTAASAASTPPASPPGMAGWAAGAAGRTHAPRRGRQRWQLGRPLSKGVQGTALDWQHVCRGLSRQTDGSFVARQARAMARETARSQRRCACLSIQVSEHVCSTIRRPAAGREGLPEELQGSQAGTWAVGSRAHGVTRGRSTRCLAARPVQASPAC